MHRLGPGLLARVDDWALIVAWRGTAAFSAGRQRTAGEREPPLPRDVDVSAGIGFHFAIAGIGLVPLEVLVDLVHRQVPLRVVRLVAIAVERADQLHETAEVGGGIARRARHLPDAVTDVRAAGVVVARAALRAEKGKADVEVGVDDRRVVGDGDDRLLDAAPFRRPRIRQVRGLAPVGAVVDHQQHVGPHLRERRVGEEDVGIVVHRVEHRPGELRQGAERRGEEETEASGDRHELSPFCFCLNSHLRGMSRRAAGSSRPGPWRRLPW